VFGETYNLNIYVWKPTNKDMTNVQFWYIGAKGGMTTGTLGYDFNDKLPSRFEANAGTRCDSLAPDAQWRPKNAEFERDFVCLFWDVPCARTMI
jgi:hypothetical protein